MDVDFVSSWTCPTMREVVEKVNAQRAAGAPSAIFALHNEIRPADLVCYLAARFGNPNGVMNALRAQHSDNLWHWDWTLETRHGLVAIWGGNFRTQIVLIGPYPFGAEIKDALIEAIKADFKQYGPAMAKVRNRLERWTEFVNPYGRLKRAIEELHGEVRQLDLDASRFEALSSPLDIRGQEKSFHELTIRFQRAFGLCFGIRAMLPVKAEAFVNLLLFALMRPDIKADDRLRQNTIRQPIDIRIKSLHINCTGFERPIDYANLACANFHALINERNDLLHGNVAPEKNAFNELYFLGTVPIFKQYRSFFERTIAEDRAAAGLDRVNGELAVVDEFIAYVFSCLKPEIRQLMTMLVQTRNLGISQDDGHLAVLFSETLVDSEAGGENP